MLVRRVIVQLLLLVMTDAIMPWADLDDQCPSTQAISRHHPILTEMTFDEGVVGYIKRLPAEEAISVFDEILDADLSNVSRITGVRFSPKT